MRTNCDFDEGDSFQFRSAHGMRAARSRLLNLAGVEVRHLEHFNRPGHAWHNISGDKETLTLVLAERGGRCEARTNLNRPAALALHRPNHISFVPSHTQVWGFTENMESVRELRLSFSWPAASRWLGSDLDAEKTTVPALMFQDRRALDLAKMLAAECDEAEPLTSLYGEGLLLALLASCFQRRQRQPASGLPSRKLRLVLEYIHDHINAPHSIPELARLVDLSPTQFARLFRLSTGLSPHRYLLSARIDKAQALLANRAEDISSVALTLGFADQSHFTRVFKKVIGTTPHGWRTALSW